MLKERETYTATKGVENEGYDFEVAMLAFYCFHLSYSKAIDFKIAIYDNQYHPFDDIVIDITTNTTEKYAIQLKHVKDRLHLNCNHFGKNGKMVLSKYFKYDFTKSDHVLLLTNGVVNEEMLVGSCTIKTKSQLTAMEKCLDTSTDQENHIYEIYNDDTCNKITFFTSQKSRTDIDEAVRQKFREKFFPDGDNVEIVAHKFRNFFQEWKKGVFNICKLDKQDIKMKIAEILFFEHIFEYKPIFEVASTKKTELFRKVLTSFNITIVDDVDHDALSNLCRFTHKKEDVIKRGQELLINAGDNENKDFALILWRLQMFPLIVKVSSDNLKIVTELVKDLQDENLMFMFVGDVSRDNFPNQHVFATLRDLEGIPHNEEVSQKFKISIQGRTAISLQELTQLNPRFADIITTKELLLISRNTLVVGEVKDTLPEPYISRRLITTVLKITSLEYFPNDLFIIRGDPKSVKSVKQKLNCKFWKFEQFFEIMSLGKRLPPKSVVLCHTSTKAKAFAIAIKYKYSNVHCLKVVDDEYLKLLFSKEKSKELRHHQIRSESELHHVLKSNINLICARPGMGKMTMLTYLQNNSPSGYWTTKFNIQEQTFDQKLPILDQQFKNCFREVYRVSYFFCGIDNISNVGLESTIYFLKKLADEKFKVWVFSEDHLKERLEKELNVVAMNIEEFSEEEQRRYVQGRLIGSKMAPSFEKILKCFKMLRHNNILGAPMHLYMLTEIFMNNPKASMEKFYIVTDIFKYFIRTKYQNYLRKTSSDHQFNTQNQIIRDGMYYRTEQYKLAAVSCLDLTFKTKVKCDKNFLGQILQSGDVVGIIFRVSSEGGVIFTQQAYGDYFAALWLLDNYLQVEDITKLIFKEEFKNTLFMFNLEMCKSNSAHIAVLYQNFEQLQQCKNLDELDALKRSPLHLACGYETTISRLPAMHEHYLFKYNTKQLVKEDEEVRRIVDFLMVNTSTDPLQVDEIVGWNLLDYAFNSLNLYAIERILLKFPETTSVVLQKLKYLEDDFFTIIYFSVKFAHPQLLTLTSQVPQFQKALKMENCNGEGLLYASVKYGFYNIVKILLEAGADTETVTVTHNKRSALHVAAESDSSNIVELLLKTGASVDIMDRYRNTPLHLASSKGAYASAKLLIAFGADVNFTDNFGRSSLQLAATYGHTQVLQLLLASGATPDTCDRLGNSPQGCAIDKNHQKIVEILACKEATTTTGLQDVEEYVSYPLHWVASIGQVEKVVLLLGEGWDIDKVDHLGRTALYRAVSEDFVKVVETCIANGATVNIPDTHKVTPLCKAISNGNLEITKLLVHKDADVNGCDSFGYTPLHWAAMSGKPGIVKVLLTKNPDLEVVDDFGRKPVTCAVESGHIRVVQLLTKETNLEKVAQERSRFIQEYTNNMITKLSSFEEAVITGNYSLVKKFLKQEKVTVTDNVLHEVISKGHKKIVELLLQNNVITNSSVLHWATFTGDLEIVELLVRYKVDVNAVDDFGYSSVAVAAMRGHSEVLEVLLKNDGNAKGMDECGNSPLDWACKNGYVECVRILLEKDSVDHATQENLLNVAKKQRRFLKIAKLE